MNNSQNRSIVVVSPSDIVLAGLAEILKGSLAGEVIVLHRGDEIIDYPQLNGNILVIATPKNLKKVERSSGRSFLQQEQFSF